MSQANAQLQAAIHRLAAQPGVTADQVAQLQAAINVDPDLLAGLNGVAQAGQLKDFAWPEPGIAPSPIGRYDLATGTVTLPASSFQATGTVPTADLAASLRVQAMSVQFAHGTYQDAAGTQQPISQDMLNNFQQAINDSPVLAQQVKAAATARPEPHIKHLAIASIESGLGGGYDGVSKTLSVPATILQSNANGRFDSDNLTFTIGHEVAHGFAYADYARALTKFDNDVIRIAKDANPINDYTGPIGERIQAARESEAQAQVAGWNALVSKHQQAGSSLDDLYRSSKRTHDFIEYDVAKGQAVPKQGVVLNNDMTLSETPDNLASVGKYYFDKFPKGHAGVPVDQTATLGPHREADNINYAGRGAISRAITLDRTFAHAVDGVEPQMHINMAQLRLDERLIERLGLAIQVRPEERQPYYDTSQSPAALHHFDHTRSGPSQNQHVPLEPVHEVAPAPAKPSDPTQPSHPDHRLYGQIRDLVRGQDQQHGRQWDQTSERLSASLLALSKDAGLTRVDHVVFSQKTDQVAAGENVFIVQGRLDDPAHVRAHMKTEEATRTPESASFAKVEALNERAASQAVAQTQSQAQEDIIRGPSMGR